MTHAEAFVPTAEELHLLEERIHDMSVAQRSDAASRAFIGKYHRRLGFWAGSHDPDLLQGIYEQLYLRGALAAWDPGHSSLPTFLRTVVRRRTIELWRRRRKEDLLADDKSPAGVATGGGEEAVQAAEVLRILQGQLSDKQWRLFELGFLQELPRDEIAQLLGWQVGTVHTRLKELRQQARRLLSALHDEALVDGHA